MSKPHPVSSLRRVKRKTILRMHESCRQDLETHRIMPLLLRVVHGQSLMLLEKPPRGKELSQGTLNLCALLPTGQIIIKHGQK